MKRFYLVVIFSVFLISVSSFSQSGDVSLWTKVHKKGSHISTEYIPWVTYDSGELFLEFRNNFDWGNSTTLFLGKSFQLNDSVVVIPEIGFVNGPNYNSFTGQILLCGGSDNVSWISMNQYSWGSGDSSTNFVYHWTEILFKVNERVSVGVGEQVYWEPGIDAELDIGPVVKFLFSKGFYLKLWGTINPTQTSNDKKLFAGVGKIF